LKESTKRGSKRKKDRERRKRDRGKRNLGCKRKLKNLRDKG
jgi:hypothetical protein